MASFPRARRSGFTLIELLVVIAVIALLIGILLPSLGSARDTARKTRCLANLNQMHVAAVIYSSENRRKAYIPNQNTGDDDIAYLYPDYMSDARAAVCPSTRNKVDTSLMISEEEENVALRWSLLQHQRVVLQHLTQSAKTKNDDGTHPDNRIGGGHSYEVWAWQDTNKYPDGTVVWTSTQPWEQRGWPELYGGRFTGTRRDVLKTESSVAFPSKMLLVLENDQGAEGTINNYPDDVDNHQKAGLNIGFCDGHARWFSAGPGIIDTYMDSHADPPGNATIVQPLLRSREFTYAGRSLTEWYYQR
ncbi:MAG: type II secretion system protein [Phycisphaerales bacterium]